MREFNMRILVDENVEVLVDENVWTPNEIDEWHKFFYDAYDIQDIARYALTGVLNLGELAFIEGFGYMKVNGSYPIGVDEELKCKSVEIKGLSISYEVETD